MIIGRVTGAIISTVKCSLLDGRKLLYVTPETPEGKIAGKSFIAIDMVQAGPGDRVLVIDEGGSANIVLEGSNLPIRTIIAGIIDNISIE